MPAIRYVTCIVCLCAAAPLPSARADTCQPWMPSGRGGYLLPSGYLSTRGTQIVDSYGNPVRIASIGWDGSDGPAGTVPHGLWATSYRAILDSIKAAGFNATRIPWTDVNLDAKPPRMSGAVNFEINSDLSDLTTIQTFHRIVDYAGRIGLKVIFDHHSNEGCCGQQANGLWFDDGPGSDGTDGAGHPGQVSKEKFQQHWVRFAGEFARNATVIGFDLDNEPTLARATWGDGGPADIHAMYERVGNAVLATDPGSLIIVEGPIEWSSVFGGDLRGVASKPVVLTIPDRLVYSVHEYPIKVGGQPMPDAGPDFIQNMNLRWGYLVTQGIAPVWIGEMGSSMRSADADAWARSLLDYMNGALGSEGGPTFAGDRQPLSGSWWHIGVAPDEPDGLQSGWGHGQYKEVQLAVTDRMLFRPRSARKCPPQRSATD